MAIKPTIKPEQSGPVQEFIGTAYDVVKKVHDNLDAILNLDLQSVNDVNDDFSILQANITQLFNDTEVLLTQIDTNASELQASATQIEEAVANFGKYYLGTKASDPSLNNESNPLVEGNFYFNSTADSLRFYTDNTWISPQEITINAANSASASASTASTHAAQASFHKADAEAAMASAETSEAAALQYRNAAQIAASDAQDSATHIETFLQSAINAANSANTDADRAEQARIGVEAAELAAANSAMTASQHESNAATFVGLAEAAELGAVTAQDKAEQWAEELTDTEVEPGKYSAKHHATKATDSEAAADLSATQAQVAQIAAETAEDNAKTSETNAKTSEVNASASALDADNSESSAQTYATDAQNSATSASTSATIAEGHKLDAASSAQAASTSETNASASETAAANSETAAAGHASDALASKTAAASSESSALSHKNAAAVSAANALLSEQNASSSETNSAAILTSVESLIDQFGDQYLGAKASDPTLDNDGNALAVGAVYLNTTDNVLKFYSGSSWINPESNAVQAADNAEASALAAATSATTAGNHATSAQSSATSASSSKADAELASTNAETSETNALASENAAATSASNAQTSANDASLSASAAETSKIGAETAETNATTKADEAASSAQEAQTAKTGAETAENKAEKWAEELTDVEVETGKYSAKHHAEKSADSASAASTSEANALSHKNDAATAASNAATSETNAESSASSASLSATNADAAEAAALGYRNQAQTAATEADTSAGEAALSESNAATSATNAANSATATDADRVAAETAKNTAQSAAATAITKADEVNTSADNAATSETNAANSAADADSSATDAFASETKAEQWATELEDVEVEPGKYSAFHHAQKAEDSAFVANASEIAAETAETNAQNSANAAATSESNAAASETSASQSASTAVAAKDAAQLAESGAQAYEDNAATSATQAANSASAASTSETNAAISETNADTSAVNAMASEDRAEAWAETDEDIEVEAGKYSAQHHAIKSASSATSASNSASTATTQAGLATTAKDDAVTAKNAAESAEATAITKANEASSSATAASTSEMNAAVSESNAATSETNAANSETAASGYEADALIHKNAAQASETKASQWAEQAENVEVETGKFSALHHAAKADTSATEAATSATNASNAESAANTAKTAAETARAGAETAETSAQSHATSASDSAVAAGTSETNAATSETNAANSATQSANSASAAQTAETNAGNYAVTAQTARDQTLAAFDSFDDRYLGQRNEEPTVDNDGDPLVAGSLYFDSSSGQMRVYDGTQWLNAYASLDGALLVANDLADLNDVNIAKQNLGLDKVDNVSAANLRNRSTHTGSQAISTITGLQTALNSKAASSHSHAIADVTNLQSTLDGKSDDGHGHVIADVTGLQTALNGKVGTSGYNKTNWDEAYSWGDHGLEGYLKSVSWSQVTGKPSTFSPSAHTHSISEVSGLQTALAGKAPTSHTHSIANVTGLQSALDDKSDLGHIHAISEVTGLQTALDGKAASSHTHSIANVTGLQTALNAKLPSSSYTASDVLTKLKTVDGSGSGLDADLLDGLDSTGFIKRSDVTEYEVLSFGLSGTPTVGYKIITNISATNRMCKLKIEAGQDSYTNATLAYVYWYFYNGAINSPRYISFAAGDPLNSFEIGVENGKFVLYIDDPGYYTQFRICYLRYGTLQPPVSEMSGWTWANEEKSQTPDAPYKSAIGGTCWHGGNDGSGSNLDADLLDGQHGSYYRAWGNLTGIPATASRWPSWTEVTGKPALNITNWNTAFGWGDHATEGYLKSVSWSGVTGKPSTFTPSAHTHAISNVTGLQSALDDKSDTGHTHAFSELTSVPATASRWPSWTEVTSKPSTFTPSAHTHTSANISDFTEATQDVVGGMVSTNTESGISVTYNDTNGKLNFNVNDPTITLTGDVSGSAKMTNLGNVSIAVTVADDSHAHTIANVDGLQSALNGKAASSHGHTISNVSGLDTALDGKSDTGHGHTISDVTGLQASLDGKAAALHSHAWSNITSGVPATATRWPSWSEVTSKPASFTPTAHTHTIGEITGLQGSLDSKINNSEKGVANGVATLDGTGKIPNAQLPSFVDDVVEYDDLASLPAAGETGKLYVALDTGKVYRWSGTNYIVISDSASSADEASKLSTARSISLTGDASGSTTFDGSKNVSISVAVKDDSHNHTIANVDGLQTALNGKAPTSHSHTIANVTGLQTALNGKSATGHTHAWADIETGVPATATRWPTWSEVTSKPATFTPASHTHAISNITNLQTTLNGKAAVSHEHDISDVTGLQTALSGKAASSHTHSISNVTGLQTALNDKASASHNHAWDDITSGVPTTATRWPAWSEVTSKPSTFTPRSHTHTPAEVGLGNVANIDFRDYGLGATTSANTDIDNLSSTVLFLANGSSGPDSWPTSYGTYPSGIHWQRSASVQTELAIGYGSGGRLAYRQKTGSTVWSDWKAVFDVDNLPTISQVTGLQNALNGKAASSHTHTIANISGLQTALSGKVSTSGYNKTNWDTAYNWGDHASAGYAADSSVVKLTGSQTITGLKTFSGGIAGNGSGLSSVNAAKLNGQNASYYLDWANVTNKPDPTITLTGDMSGSITMTNLGGGSLNATFTGNVSDLQSKDVRTVSGSNGANSYHPTPDDLPDKTMTTYFGYINESAWQTAIAVKGWSSGYTAWELIGPANTTATNKWYLRSGNSTSWGTSYEIYHEGHKPTPSEIGAASSSHSHSISNVSGLQSALNGKANASHTHRTYIEKTPTNGEAQTIVGDLDIDNRAEQTSSLVRVIANDAGTAELRLQGPNSGTGRLYVGQSTTYGGGIEYAGDNVDPGNSGAGVDYTTLFRVSGGSNANPARIWTARNSVSNNSWEFRGRVIGLDGQSGSWGSNMGELSGAFVASIPNDASATWVWSAASGATFRCGFQMYNGGNIARLYVGSSYYLFNSGSFTATGDVTAFSDERLKENIVTIDSAIDKVKQLRGVYFNKKDDETKTRKTGLIAQEVEKVLPELVGETDEGIKHVAYGNTVGVLVEAIKEQQNEIDELKALVKKLLERK